MPMCIFAKKIKLLDSVIDTQTESHILSWNQQIVFFFFLVVINETFKAKCLLQMLSPIEVERSHLIS